jgi:hypothetical protein
MLDDDFCSIKSALSNGVLEVKSTLAFYTKTEHFLQETKEFRRPYYSPVL